MLELEEHTFIFNAGGVDKKTFFYASGPVGGPLLIFLHGFPAIAISWRHQLIAFASLGFRVVAPDMPGYGRSTARKAAEDYCQASVHCALNALLDHLSYEEAVWIGHDWGAVTVWAYAEHFPERCVGVVGIAVPSHTMELGWEAILKTVDRRMYPKETYPYGQYAYQHYYKTHFKEAVRWCDADARACLRAMYMRSGPTGLGKPAPTASVGGEGEFLGGEKPDPAWREIPTSMLCVDDEYLHEVLSAFERNSFWGPIARYLSHDRDEEYFMEKAKHDGKLHMPTLYIEGRYDSVCDTATSTLAARGRRDCTKLTEASVDAGHWVALEKPEEVNAFICRWLLKSCEQHWPGFWSRKYISR